MIGFNHAVAGGLIAKFVPLPLAIPLAFLSHFALDALPHYGIPQESRDKSWFWRVFFVLDFIAAWGIAAVALFHWRRPDMFIAGLVACSPDFLWVARVVRTRSFDLSHHQSRFTRWHAAIQRYERPWGLAVELPVAIGLFYLVRP